MADFEINEEHAIDLLIFWITGIDGNITYDEIKAEEEVLRQLNYDPRELHGRTMNYVSSLNSEKIASLIEEAKQYLAANLEHDKKVLVLQLLEHLASSDQPLTEQEKAHLEELKRLFTV